MQRSTPRTATHPSKRRNPAALAGLAMIACLAGFAPGVYPADGGMASFDDREGDAGDRGREAALSLGPPGDHVTMGPAPGLGAADFTLELWFRWDGTGQTVNTGPAGVTAYPLIAKGRGEETDAGQSLNYFLGIASVGGVLVADFEEHASGAAPGANHPVAGQTIVTPGEWHHAAATYDGACWQLYLDGHAETNGSHCPSQPPSFDSFQHAALGAALDSQGRPEGRFDGSLDEVRIWSRALSGNEILANMLLKFPSPTDQLVGLYHMDHASGGLVADSKSPAQHGRLVGSPRLTDDAALSGASSNRLLLPAVTACPRGRITIPVSLDSIEGVLSLDLSLSYDPAVLSPVDVETSALTEDFTLNFNTGVAGAIDVSLFTTVPTNGGGEVVWIAFDVLSAGGGASDLIWSEYVLDEGNVAVTAIDGRVDVVNAQTRLSVPREAVAVPGSTIVVPVSADPAGGVGLDLTLEYDPAVLQAIDAATTQITQDFLLTSSLSTPGVALISMFNSTPMTGSGPILEIEFLVLGSGGETSPLDLAQVSIDEGAIGACLENGNVIASACSASGCDDGNPCTTDICDPLTGQCAHPSAADGTSCDDGDACTELDACVAGICSGAAPDCDDSNACTLDSCDAGSGCVNTPDPGACPVIPCPGAESLLSLPDAIHGIPGATVNVPLSAFPALGISADLRVEYDPSVLLATDVLKTSVTDDFSLTSNLTFPGVAMISLFNSTPMSGAGPIVEIVFQVIGSDGETTPLTLAVGDLDEGLIPTCLDDGDFLVSSCLDSPEICDDGQACTADSCDTGTGLCVNTPLADLTVCDDSNACTTDDACSAGVCAGAALSCDDGNACTDDSCDPASGCFNENNVAPCDDANACTTDDTCSAGICIGGLPLACDDGNVCTDDSCDPASGCVFDDNTAPCDDANACTTGDTCSSGACVGATPLSCDDGNACTDDSCDPASGCLNENNVAPCDDANACTTDDTCSAGVCAGGSPVACDDGNVCTDDSCDPTSGCVFDDNTAPCDDANACTTGDTCSSGACVGATPLSCDDGNACTDDSCDPASGCLAENNTAVCDDGDNCTDDDVCSAGVCSGQPSDACGDALISTQTDQTLSTTPLAHQDVYLLGSTVEPFVPSFLTASAGLDALDVLSDGTILFSAHTNALVFNGVSPLPLTEVYAFDPTSGTISYVSEWFGINLASLDALDALDDGTYAFSTDFDQSILQPQGFMPLSRANVYRFDPATGLVSVIADLAAVGVADVDAVQVFSDERVAFSTRADATLALPGGPLNVYGENAYLYDAQTGDVTLAFDGRARGLLDLDAMVLDPSAAQGTPDCDDANPCTLDQFDPLLGCLNTPDPGASCDDGDACTADDSCDATGACVGAAPLDCNDGNVCTLDGCDPAAGCVNLPDVGASCDDGNTCTSNDSCDATGTCVGAAPLDCNDGNACTLDSCDPAAGCLNLPDIGATCDDSNACTTGDSCDAGGSCAGGPPPACDDSNACTDDSCDPTFGCVYADNTAPCDDGLACTTDDVCSAGVCGGDPTGTCGGTLFSVATDHVAGPVALAQQDVYREAGSTIQLFVPSFLASSSGLDALDVLADGTLLFSAKTNALVFDGATTLPLTEVYAFDPVSGAITAVPDWFGLHLASLDALDALDDGSYAFSVDFTQHVLQPQGLMELNQANVYRFDPATGLVVLVQDMLAVGLADLDGVHLESDGRVAFSTVSDTLVVTPAGPVDILNENAYVYDPASGNISLSFDGNGLGLESLDALSLE